MDKLIIKYKLKSQIDNEIERDIAKVAKKHKFVLMGSGLNMRDNFRDIEYGRNNGDKESNQA